MAIGVVFNPRAGRNRKDPGASERMKRALGDHGVVEAPATLEALQKTAESFKRQGIDLLAIAGGDGTNHVTLTHFAEVYGDDALPSVALLRGGTMNTVADSLRLPRGRPEGLLDGLVLKYLARESLPSIEQWTLSVNGKLGFLWGLGVVPQFLREYYDTGSPSPWTAARTLARGIGSTLTRGAMFKRLREGVVCDVLHAEGHWQERRWLAVSAGTIADIGLGFKPYYLAPSSPGAMHLLGIHATPLEFVMELPKVHRAQAMAASRATSAVVERFVVHVPGKSMRYMIDGDVFEHEGSEMLVTMGRKVRIIT
ncbi:MAG: diacylglycerol kinase family protein [Deltaproteobacteria bacterium]|nr:diacylglycerol kinase family protein [Deltaproteobacteria bacterium]